MPSRQARIGISKAHGRCARAFPCREHAEHLGQILDHDARAQLVEIEFVDQRFHALARNVEKKAAAVLGRRFGGDEVGDDLALRCQERAKARGTRAKLQHVGADKPMQKASRLVAGDLYHSPVRK